MNPRILQIGLLYVGPKNGPVQYVCAHVFVVIVEFQNVGSTKQDQYGKMIPDTKHLRIELNFKSHIPITRLLSSVDVSFGGIIFFEHSF